MTIEDRIVIELADLQRVTMECKECGSAISARPDSVIVHVECPHCRRPWVQHGTEIERALTKLAQALEVIRTHATSYGFTLRLEIAHPRA